MLRFTSLKTHVFLHDPISYSDISRKAHQVRTQEGTSLVLRRRNSIAGRLLRYLLKIDNVSTLSNWESPHSYVHQVQVTYPDAPVHETHIAQYGAL